MPPEEDRPVSAGGWLWFSVFMITVVPLFVLWRGDDLVLRHAFRSADAPECDTRIAWLDGRTLIGDLLLLAIQAARVVLAWLAWRWGGWFALPVWVFLGWRVLATSLRWLTASSQVRTVER